MGDQQAIDRVVQRLLASQGIHGSAALVPYRAHDWPLLCLLHRSAMRAQIDERFGWDREAQEDRLRRHVERAQVFLVDVPGRPAMGSIALSPTDDAGELLLELFYVAPEAQGQGIGSAVLGRVLSAADTEGVSLRLAVLLGSRARALYERHGFIWTRSDQYSDHLRREVRARPTAGEGSMMTTDSRETIESQVEAEADVDVEDDSDPATAAAWPIIAAAAALRARLDPYFAADTAAGGWANAEVASAGHCAAVAAIAPFALDVNGVVGYVSTMVNGASHWFNRVTLPDGSTWDVDVTGDQFDRLVVQVGQAGTLYKGTRERQVTELNAETMARARLLASRAGIEF